MGDWCEKMRRSGNVSSKKKNLKENWVFLQRQWFSIAIIYALVVVGNRQTSAAVLWLAAVFILFCILRSDTADAFYWAVFLIPNIRMLDGTGISFVVNILMAFPVVTYFVKNGLLRVPMIALLGGFALFAMEATHDAVLCEFENIETLMGWIINVFLCIAVTVDCRVKVSKDDVFSALSTGIIMSALMYFSSGITSVSHIIKTINYGTRFTAFADDPNYYSLYICLAIACVLNVTCSDLYRFCTTILMIGIGLLTASKMCMLLMLFELMLILMQVFNSSKDNYRNRKFILLSSLAAMVIMLILKDYIGIFIQNFIRRMGQSPNQGFNLEKLTTGRSRILIEYINILSNNLICLLVGYGFGYHQFLDISTGHIAHNTYLDLCLAWGVVGTCVFLLLMFMWITSYKSSRGIDRIASFNLISTVVLMINFLDLSCLSAQMFPFLIAIALIQWLPMDVQRLDVQSRRRFPVK